MDVISVSTFFSPENLSTNRYKYSRRPQSKNFSVVVRRPEIPKNPLKTSSKSPPSNPLHSKLWLSSKISPPPPPPPPPSPPSSSPSPANEKTREINPIVTDCRQKGKIFVGNLPLWIKKSEILELFRQFGPVKSIVLIRGHENPDQNLGFCFLIYGGPTAEEAAGKAVEFDGMEFRGRVITVRLDDGSRVRRREEERGKLLNGEKREFRSKWHEERDCACRMFRMVLDAEPENWQNVVSAFERISKVM